MLATWCEELTNLKRPWCWERLRAGGEGDDRGWDCWMALLMWWTWVWVNSRSWWWTWRPGVLQSMGSQPVGHNWVTELNKTEWRLRMWYSSGRHQGKTAQSHLLYSQHWASWVVCSAVKPQPPWRQETTVLCLPPILQPQPNFCLRGGKSWRNIYWMTE